MRQDHGVSSAQALDTARRKNHTRSNLSATPSFCTRPYWLRLFAVATGVHQAEGHNQLPVREGAAQPSLSRRARPEALPQRGGALHLLQAVRSHLPRSGTMQDDAMMSGFWVVIREGVPLPAKFVLL